MYLIGDFGNTNQKIALIDNEKIVHQEKKAEISVRNIIHILKRFPQIQASIISSVVDYDEKISYVLEEKHPTYIFNDEIKIPIKNLYHTPKTLGYDRLAAAIGAFYLYHGQNCLIVDAGTCLKVDFVNEKGEFEGGSIAPGINMRFSALHEHTDHLPLIEKEKIDFLSGKSTRDSILSGVMNGVFAEVNGRIDMYLKKYNVLKVVMTGGDLKYFENKIKVPIFAAPNLIFWGLYKSLLFHLEQTN